MGGSGAIGQSVCRLLTERGARVVFTYSRSEDEARAFAATLDPELVDGVEQLDLTDRDAVDRLVGSCAGRWGSLDVVVNTAGYMHGLRVFTDMDWDEVEQTVALELFGVLHLGARCRARHASGRLRPVRHRRIRLGKGRREGCRGLLGRQWGRHRVHKALAREVADADICVNVVCPGPTTSPLLDSLAADDDMSGPQMRAMVRAIPKRRPGRPRRSPRWRSSWPPKRPAL